jgi:hypothetical protein
MNMRSKALPSVVTQRFQAPFRKRKTMNSKQWNRTMDKGFRIFLIAALLTGLVGMTGVAYASDGAGNALDFDGTDEYVNIEAVADDMALQQNSFTFSAWVKAADTHTGLTKGTILGVNYTNNNIRLCLFIGGNGDNKITLYDVDRYELPGAVIGDNTWHHVAYVRSGSTGTLYVDGISQGTHTADFTFTSDDPWSIGQEWDNGPVVSDALDGQVDEVRIWKTALDQSTIQDWMHGELTTAHPNKANLVGYWKLNDGSGTAATDSSPGIRGSGSANNGTLQNMEEGDWVTSTAPIGDTTVGDQTDITAMWSAQTDTASDGLATGLDIANVSFTNDVGDDIVFGHNNASETTTGDCPSGVSPRWQRVWYLDKTDVVTSGGNVNLTFDFGDAGEGTPGASNYTLLKRSGETGDFTSVTTTSNVSGDQVIFSGVDSTDLGSYFTLGEGTPTAVTLSDFTASPARGGYGFVLPLALVAVGAVGGTLLLRARRRRV